MDALLTILIVVVTAGLVIAGAMIAVGLIVAVVVIAGVVLAFSVHPVLGILAGLAALAIFAAGFTYSDMF